MGFWDSVLRRAPWTMAMTPNVQYIGGHDELAAYYGSSLDMASPASLWRSQPHLRTVVTFVARNIAQLGMHCFERVGETDRRRDRESVAAKALAFPDGVMTTYDLVFALVGDLLLYDRAYWFVGDSSETPTGKMLRRLPPSWVSAGDADPFRVKTWRVSFGRDVVEVPAEQILAFTGYSPTDPVGGSPTVEVLKDTLREQVEAAKYRGQIWRRGGRVSAVLERPANAPRWSDAARDAFREDWYAKFTGDGPRAGGTPLLEDGMTLRRIDFNAQEQQFVEAAKLSLTTVAAAFHVNPTMIGQNDGANYSNVREFRKMLYGDTLGPLLAQIEGRINTFLLPMLAVDQAKFYVEFNIAEKLQGNFEEQSAAIQTATGAPWMTRNEARARMNLPQVEDGDALVTPLNVLIGGQASPTDSGSQNEQPKALRGERGPEVVQFKTRPSGWDDKHTEVLRAFFKRQRAVVLSRLGGKSDWWDEDRWNKELADDLYKLGVAISEDAAKAALDGMGVNPDSYDIDRTLAFLKARAKMSAENINAKTREAVQQSLDDDEGEPADVFDEAEDSRAGLLAAAAVTAAAGFGTSEAGKQSGAATKTWITGSNPRPEHAAMDGETVAMSENFSNGLAWPGDAAGGADEVAGCNCSLSFGF